MNIELTMRLLGVVRLGIVSCSSLFDMSTNVKPNHLRLERIYDLIRESKEIISGVIRTGKIRVLPSPSPLKSVCQLFMARTNCLCHARDFGCGKSVLLILNMNKERK